jgi:hypothetical protein
MEWGRRQKRWAPWQLPEIGPCPSLSVPWRHRKLDLTTQGQGSQVGREWENSAGRQDASWQVGERQKEKETGSGQGGRQWGEPTQIAPGGLMGLEEAVMMRCEVPSGVQLISCAERHIVGNELGELHRVSLGQ